MSEKHALQILLETVVENTSGDMTDLRSYSGRSMHGRECLAVTGWDLGPLLGAIVRELENFEGDHEEVADALESIKTDQLGRGTIIYFPAVEYVDPEEIQVEDRETMRPGAEELN